MYQLAGRYVPIMILFGKNRLERSRHWHGVLIAACLPFHHFPVVRVPIIAALIQGHPTTLTRPSSGSLPSGFLGAHPAPVKESSGVDPACSNRERMRFIPRLYILAALHLAASILVRFHILRDPLLRTKGSKPVFVFAFPQVRQPACDPAISTTRRWFS